MNDKIHMITFFDNKYTNTAKVLLKEAEDTKIFTTIKGYSEYDLRNDSEYWNKVGSFILQNRRGYGYWCWKCYVIFHRLQEIDYGDILIYADAGCKINYNTPKSIAHFDKILEMLKTNDILVRQLTGLYEKCWTKKDIFDFFNYKDYESSQIQAGLQYIKKTIPLMMFYKQLFETITSNLHLLTDVKDKSTESPFLRDNRHDQSMFSISLKMSNLNYDFISCGKDDFIYTARRKLG